MAAWRRCGTLVVGMALASAACSGADRSPPRAAAPVPAAGPVESGSPGWPAPAGCREVGAALGAAKDRLPASSSGAPLGVMLLGDPRAIRVEQDMPLPLAHGEAPPSAPCLLVIELPPGPPAATRHLLGTDTVLSDYESGTHERANPAYAAARREVDQADAAEREDSAGRLHSTGDLTLDLIGLAANGLIRGVGAFVDGHRSEAAEAKLATTPPTIAEPVYRSYRLTVEDMAVEKTSRARVALVDRRSGEVWEAPRTVTATQRIEIAQGLHPRDRAIAEGRAAYHAPAELRQWEQAPIDLALSDLLAWTISATAATPPDRSGLERLLASWRSDVDGQRLAAAAPVAQEHLPEPAAGPAPRVPASPGPSLVLVEGLGGSGGGFYVAAEEILTARSLVGDTSLVRVRTAGGLVTYGIVEREDPELDLLLVHVQKDGPPLPLAGDETAPVEIDPDAALGAPVLRDGRVVAVPTAAAGGRLVGAAQLRAFLAAGQP